MKVLHYDDTTLETFIRNITPLVKIRKILFIILLRLQCPILNHNYEKFLITCHVRTDNL